MFEVAHAAADKIAKKHPLDYDSDVSFANLEKRLQMLIMRVKEKALVTTGLDLGNTLQLVFAVLLLILGVLVAIQGVKKLLEKDNKATA